ncbi:MAG: hypothetical protein ACTHJ8_05305 [Mucilaginibacter sp.]
MFKFTFAFIIIVFCLAFYSCKKSPIQPSFASFQDTLKLGWPVTIPTASQYENQVIVSNKYNDAIVASITDYGYLISASPDATFKKVSLGHTLGKNAPAFLMTIDSLKSSTTYAIRGYITVNGQDQYAPTINFTTYPGSWRRLKNFTPGLLNIFAPAPSGFAVNGNGYVMFSDGTLWEYNVKSDSWAKKNTFDLTHYVNNSEVPHVFFTINNIAYLYFKGGIWKYDDVADSWSNILQPGPGNTGPGKAFVMNNKAYILQNPNNYYYDNGAVSKVYDPVTNTLNNINVITRVANASGFATDNFLYVIGAVSYTFGYPAYTYNPVDDSFTHQTYENQDGPFAPRFNAVSFTINGEAYIGEGYYGSGKTSYFMYKEGGAEFQPVEQQFNYEYSDMNNIGSRNNGLSFVINGKAYVGFGDSGRSDFWEFTP